MYLLTWNNKAVELSKETALGLSAQARQFLFIDNITYIRFQGNKSIRKPYHQFHPNDLLTNNTINKHRKANHENKVNLGHWETRVLYERKKKIYKLNYWNYPCKFL